MQVWGITDVGLVRKDNQDAFAALERTDSGHTVCVVCDGMGGTAGGKQASHIAVDTYMREIQRILSQDMSLEQLREASSFAVSLANRAVREAAQQSEEFQNMGTTLVSAVGYGGGAVVSNVGDSRAYHITRSSIVRVTRDHSLVESMVERGDITAEEARRHPNRNLITRALGPDALIECDGYICPMEPGEFILLCSDGLVNTVTDQEMLEEINRPGAGEACLARLLEISMSRGATDNVTAVLMRENDEKEAV